MVNNLINRPETVKEFQPAEPIAPIGQAAISVRNLSKRFGNATILRDVNFDIAEGEMLVLLGQSGSGKTTILRIIAGLTAADEGAVRFKDQLATHLPVQQRNLGIVFQDGNLFQKMTVAENIAFGLELRKQPRALINQRIDEMLTLINLSAHRDKYPAQLSGGQRQRVALARALAYQPAALLFDEPFSALDAGTRVALRREVRSLLKAARIPALFITHDQEEALELGDRIAVLNQGEIEQIGSPYQLYNYPHNEFVASFLGAINVLLGSWQQGEVIIDSLRLRSTLSATAFSINQPVKVVFRPEDIVLDFQAQLLDTPHFLGRGTIESISYVGPTERIVVQLPNGYPISVTRTKWRVQEMELSPGDQVVIGLKTYQLMAHFPLEGESGAKVHG